MNHILLIFMITLFGIGGILIIVALMKGAISTTYSENSIRFQRMLLIRLGYGLMSIGFLILTLQMLALWNAEDISIKYVYIPCGFICCIVMVYVAGPQDLRIDLTTRACEALQGWPFVPKRTRCSLTEDAFLYVRPGGQSCQVCLDFGKQTKLKFILNEFSLKRDALAYAQEMAAKLSLPVH